MFAWIHPVGCELSISKLAEIMGYIHNHYTDKSTGLYGSLPITFLLFIFSLFKEQPNFLVSLYHSTDNFDFFFSGNNPPKSSEFLFLISYLAGKLFSRLSDI